MSVKLDPNKEVPKVNITVGHGMGAVYSSWLEPSDSDTELASWDTSEVDLSSATSIKQTADLDQKFFFWKVKVINVPGGNGQYSVTVNFTQNGEAVCKPIICKGKFKGGVALCFDSVLFIV